MKAWLAAADIKPPRVHDLAKLVKTFEDHGISLPLVPIEMEEVTKYATVWRYYEIPEAKHTDLDPLRQAIQILRVGVLKEIADRGIDLGRE